MSNPHPILSQIYGTGQTEEDLEKTASVEALVKLAAEAGAELDDEALAAIEDLSTEEIHELIGELAGDEGDPEEDWNQKVAEADMLGRVMAHSFYQESGNIEKTAGIKELASKAYGGAKKGAKWLAGMKGENLPGRHRQAYVAAQGALSKGRTIGQRARGMGRAAKNVSPELGLAAAGGTAAALSGRKKEKKSSVDDLILARAQEIAQAYGLEKQAGVEDELDLAALQLLEQEGFDLSSIVGE